MSNDGHRTEPALATEPANRRDFLTTTSSLAMAGGLAAGYGTLGVMAVRFLYPTRSDLTAWCFVSTVDEWKPGEATTFVSPSGAQVVIARQSEGATAEDFIALSSVCPHLGCQVHWEAQNNRFFCPCHNGVFDPQGNALEGPPAKGGQKLTRFPLKVENGMLFVEAPVRTVGRTVARDERRTHPATSSIEEA